MAVVAAAAFLALSCLTAAAPCRGYPEQMRPLIRRHVEALRALERETSDRIAGLDTRHYPLLAAEARKAADAIGSPEQMRQEETLVVCGASAPAIRRICAGAARALASVIDELEKGAATKASREAFADAVTQCERWMDLRPLSTPIRIPN